MGPDGGVTVLDFAMARSGTRFHDLAHLYMHLKFMRWHPRLKPAIVNAAQEALLRGYDPAVSADDPLFRLMLLQHLVCHVAFLEERQTGALEPAYRWFLRRHWARCAQVLGLPSGGGVIRGRTEGGSRRRPDELRRLTFQNLMLIKNAPDIPSSEITNERLYLHRREFIRLTTGALASAAGAAVLAACGRGSAEAPTTTEKATGGESPFPPVARRLVTTQDPPNTFEQITGYNNFYEFGTGKGDPKQYAGRLITKPWTVTIDGLCNKPGDYHLEDLIKTAELEERIYRHRCVEAWSMVIPWVGVPLASILNRVEPTGKAAFVEFTTVLRPKEMPGVSDGGLNWPYREGLRLDEAMHSLTLLAVGLYGKTLLNQNGAPIRLVVPWKYGFKGAKSIVRIRLTDEMPTYDVGRRESVVVRLLLQRQPGREPGPLGSEP